MDDCTTYQTPYSTWALCFLAGGLAGASAALLLAPQSGRDTRKAMRRQLQESTDSARGLRDRAVDSARDMKDRAVDSARNAVDSARNMKDRAVRRGEEVRDEATRRVGAAAHALAGDGDGKDVSA